MVLLNAGEATTIPLIAALYKAQNVLALHELLSFNVFLSEEECNMGLSSALDCALGQLNT